MNQLKMNKLWKIIMKQNIKILNINYKITMMYHNQQLFPVYIKKIQNKFK